MVLTIAKIGDNIINVTEREDVIDMLPSKIFFDNFFDDFEPSNRKLHEMMKCDIFEEGNDYVIYVHQVIHGILGILTEYLIILVKGKIRHEGEGIPGCHGSRIQGIDEAIITRSYTYASHRHIIG